MLDYYATQQAHIRQAQTLMAERYGHVPSSAEFPGFGNICQRAFAILIHWLAEFCAANPQWVAQLKRVEKQQILDPLVAQLGLSGIQLLLANVFAGALIDVAIAGFIGYELNTDSSQKMFSGSMPDTFARWREVPLS
jgi:hypothetical protein